MRPSKVCIVSSAHPALDSRVFHREARSLVGAGYRVVLIARHPGNATVDGIRIIGLRKPAHRAGRFLSLWRPALLAFRQRAAVYHFHDPDLIPAMILLRLLIRCRVIYDVHEDLPRHMLSKDWLPWIARRPLARIAAAAEHVGLRRFDAVIAAGRDILRHFPASPKLAVVHNYPSILAANKRRVRTPEREGKTVVVYIGELAPFRCVREMILAAGILQREAVLILVGAFDDPRFEGEMRRSAGTNVEFTGLLSQAEIPGILRDSDIGLVCFRRDPNTLDAVERNRKLYEYMAAELPVIVPDFPAWRGFVDELHCGMAADTSDPEAIARAVRFWIRHPEQSVAAGRNGREAVLQSFNWEAEAETLLAVYRRLAGV